ncbi:MAG: substrate-binding domain-containing protein [Promethearchaeota archaeon]|nr:MAG: substrate-binding domain-containing protein [Candidatus Lokiarchaeota archaeon]
MSTRKPLKIILSEHKTAVIIALIIIAGGSVGTYFIIDYLNAQNPEKITLATTTSTYDSGLLDYLLPKFTEQTGIQIKVLSVGTGTAFQYGEDGNADVILVHSRSREDDFVNASRGEDGIPFGIHRACIMYNDFIIVGHSSNPAILLDDDNITTVMTKLRDAMDTGNMTFFSRGDGSGTHSKEEELWEMIGVVAAIRWTGQPDNYTETGQGMAVTLQMTYEDVDPVHEGYTLVDRATWLSFNDTYTSLNILAESVVGEDFLLNLYGAIPVNPVLHPHVKYLSACRFVGFLTSPYGQALIDSYTKNNAVLFHANFGSCNISTSCSTTDGEIAIWTPYQAEFAGLAV